MSKFQVVSEYQPAGDQPEAIAALAAGIENGLDEQTLLGVTGSGKTFTMAKVIEAVQRPTLVLAHNKTLAAQLCAEFKEFFPNNAVEYFVSYYDYYQPEAYIPHTDTFIEKDSAVNEEIDRLRLAATASLMERRDVIVVSSVSCIYGLGEPEDFAKMMVSLRVGTQMEREELLKKLVSIRYERNDIAFERNMFRVRGDTVEIFPAYWKDSAIRVEFFGDEIDRISEINVVTGAVIRRLETIPIWPATHYVTPKEKMDAAVQEIYRELEERVGNVLGSNGSVIPRFRDQIAKGGPVTVTHPDIIRYFMTIPEACRLVLEAGTMGKGGEIFIFDMGEPVKIADLAKRMIELSGLQVDKDIEIKYTGLRPGEKLYEELLSNKENTKETPHEKIRVAAVREYAYKDVVEHIDLLAELSLHVHILPMVREMKSFVPEFKSQNSQFTRLDGVN